MSRSALFLLSCCLLDVFRPPCFATNFVFGLVTLIACLFASIRTPLHLAAWAGHLDCVAALLSAGAQADARDNAGRTPLMRATEQHHYDIMEALMEAGFSLNAKDNSGQTVCFMSCFPTCLSHNHLNHFSGLMFLLHVYVSARHCILRRSTTTPRLRLCYAVATIPST